MPVPRLRLYANSIFFMPTTLLFRPRPDSDPMPARLLRLYAHIPFFTPITLLYALAPTPTLCLQPLLYAQNPSLCPCPDSDFMPKARLRLYALALYRLYAQGPDSACPQLHLKPIPPDFIFIVSFSLPSRLSSPSFNLLSSHISSNSSLYTHPAEPEYARMYR